MSIDSGNYFNEKTQMILSSIKNVTAKMFGVSLKAGMRSERACLSVKRLFSAHRYVASMTSFPSSELVSFFLIYVIWVPSTLEGNNFLSSYGLKTQY